MKALVVVFSVALLLALAGAEIYGATISVSVSPDQYPSFLEVPNGAANVSGGRFRISTDTDLPDLLVYVNANATDITDILNVRLVSLSDKSVLDQVGFLSPDFRSGLRTGFLAANTFKDFEFLFDISPHAAVGSIYQLRIDGVATEGTEVQTHNSFPLWGGNVVTVGECFPPPMPPSVWLNTVVVRAYQRSVWLELGLSSDEQRQYYSAEVSVLGDNLAQPFHAECPPEMFGSWTWYESQDDKLLEVVLAGITPLKGGKPFLRLKFDVSKMRPGDNAGGLMLVRLNEDDPQLLEWVIQFQPLNGDISVNGDISSLDAAFILRWLVGFDDSHLDKPPDFRLWTADVSGNGQITAYDAGLILLYAAGLINHFPIDEGRGKVVVIDSSGPIVVVTKGKTRIEGEKYVIPILVSEPAMAGEFEIGPVGDGVEVVPGDVIKGATFLSNRVGNKLKVAFAGSDQPAEGGELLLLKFASEPKAFTVKARINEGPVQILSTAVEQKSWGEVKSSFLK